MKPGHIRVFDGLRIATEHLNHLQGSLHSALQDLREILGLGKVYHGFEVVREGNQVTIKPGLAFDFQKNRIVCDEPKTFDVAFEPDEDTKYVCIKYHQVEDGQIEGRFTLIWDSCSVEIRTTIPEHRENLIQIAKLIKSAKDGAFEIISLIPLKQCEEPEEEFTKELENGKNSPEPSIPFEAEVSGKPLTEDHVSTDSSGMTSIAKVDTGFLENSGLLTSDLKSWRLQVKQGVIRFAIDSGSEKNLSTVILEPLKKKLSSKDSCNSGDLLFTLAEKEVPLDFTVSSLTCRTTIHSTFDVTKALTPAEAPATEEETPLYMNLKFQSMSQGEVTFIDDDISQFGISMIPSYPFSAQGGTTWLTSELIEIGIAHLPFSSLMKVSENAGTARDVLQHLQLLIRVDRIARPGFKIVCNLLWKGGISEEIIRKIETQETVFIWGALMAWKVLGESQV